MELILNGRAVPYVVTGPRGYGAEEVLLEQDDDLLAGLSWHGVGFATLPFLTDDDHQRLQLGLTEMIRDLLQQIGVPSLEGFTLESYHRFLGTAEAEERHARLVAAIRSCFPLERLPLSVTRIEDRLSEICGAAVHACNPHNGVREFCIRIIRPDSTDCNPLHRDVWLDRLRDAVNIYAPLAGSSPLSSLALVPGSHLWKESEIERTEAGAQVNGNTYTVPAVTGARRPLDLERPDPGSNEVLVFSPYLIHGSAINFQNDRTRVSLEMRFWRSPA
ncbi:MAG: phytanoyl-CoA dioxygenase family protein [Acidobacteriota bacterium]|nr:phytanoyl-CoA dioxygenase family protein [Acidobacteriota bacterium]MDH3786630.1 phytanoyl-CoA dioxygenase family protein [Acidobacteriota bacterium]